MLQTAMSAWMDSNKGLFLCLASEAWMLAQHDRALAAFWLSWLWAHHANGRGFLICQQNLHWTSQGRQATHDQAWDALFGVWMSSSWALMWFCDLYRWSADEL